MSWISQSLERSSEQPFRLAGMCFGVFIAAYFFINMVLVGIIFDDSDIDEDMLNALYSIFDIWTIIGWASILYGIAVHTILKAINTRVNSHEY